MKPVASRPDMSHIARSIRRRPIVVEHDRDHDHRAGRDRYRADHRPLFEDGDDGRPPVSFVLCAKRQPATPIRNLRLAPSRWFASNNAKRSYFGSLQLSSRHA